MQKGVRRPDTDQARVLAAVRAGAETSRDIEAYLEGALPVKIIAGHLSNLCRSGLVRVVGRRKYPGVRTCSVYRPPEGVGAWIQA
jgi:hypothetical protein